MFSQRLSPSGHIPLDEETLSGMTDQERVFWKTFLKKAGDVFYGEQAKGTPHPFPIPPELHEDFRAAIVEYHGDMYCPFAQLRAAFDCRELPPPAMMQPCSGCVH